MGIVLKLKDITFLFGELIKARQTILLVYTGVMAYFITAFTKITVFNWLELLFLFLSLYFAISGTTVLNMYIDKDIDAIMERTKNRPLPSGKVSPLTVLITGIILTILGILLSSLTLNWLTTLIIFLGFFFDVVVYTVLLKRRTKFSIIFGGIAGGLPAWAGRIAILGNLDWIGFLLLIFVLAWIPVHILTIALIPKNYKGYKDAGVPMWPIVSSETQTMRVIAIGAFISSLALYEVARLLGAHAIIRIIWGLCCAIIIILVVKSLIKPSNKLTFIIFKIASLYMILGFFLVFLGVVFN
ncbi:MAG: protoheme IX farnesyltransferase [Candidatus Lokiarchaeota archaeon]|nr:protoheme IX farnesyltransferase [Candidatus Lokiarchaeota archaeon]